MSIFETNESAYDNLLVPGCDFVTERGVLASGENVVRGTALGKITSGGQFTPWGSAGSDDGHRTFYAIAAEDCDASDSAKGISVYLKGDFYRDNIVIDGDATADDVSDIVATARDIGIFLIDSISSQT